jgi:hypothetical protein
MARSKIIQLLIEVTHQSKPNLFKCTADGTVICTPTAPPMTEVLAKTASSSSFHLVNALGEQEKRSTFMGAGTKACCEMKQNVRSACVLLHHTLHQTIWVISIISNN